MTFVELVVAPDQLAQRVETRDHPFMPASLLSSQIAAFEPLAPEEHGVSAPADHADIQTVAASIVAALQR